MKFLDLIFYISLLTTGLSIPFWVFWFHGVFPPTSLNTTGLETYQFEKFCAAHDDEWASMLKDIYRAGLCKSQSIEKQCVKDGSAVSECSSSISESKEWAAYFVKESFFSIPGGCESNGGECLLNTEMCLLSNSEIVDKFSDR